MKIKYFFKFCITTFFCMFAIFIGGQTDAQDLPKSMLWTCYDVGSSGYIQASAMADALSKTYGIRIRLLPSGTSIGRLMPLTSGKVDCGFLANEVYFAVEGLYDFAERSHGPQDLRIILAHPTTIALATTKTSGIKTLDDIKGKRLSYIPGAPTLNVKATAFLAFVGLSWDDVERVEFPSYAAALSALKERKTDASVVSTSAALMYELESSPQGLYWPEFPPENKEGWERMQKIAPFLSPKRETIGAGISKDKPVNLCAYRYPIVTVYADADENWVYNLTRAFDKTFDLYKNAHPVMVDWKIQESGVPPADAPFHKGAVRYLKEQGVWTEDHDRWNRARIKHIKIVQDAWKKAIDEAEKKGISSKEFPDFWMKIRSEALEQ